MNRIDYDEGKHGSIPILLELRVSQLLFSDCLTALLFLARGGHAKKKCLASQPENSTGKRVQLLILGLSQQKSPDYGIVQILNQLLRFFDK